MGLEFVRRANLDLGTSDATARVELTCLILCGCDLSCKITKIKGQQSFEWKLRTKKCHNGKLINFQLNLTFYPLTQLLNVPSPINNSKMMAWRVFQLKTPPSRTIRSSPDVQSIKPRFSALIRSLLVFESSIKVELRESDLKRSFYGANNPSLCVQNY